MRLVDGGKPVIGKVYHEFFQIQQHVDSIKGMPEDRREVVSGLVLKRWNQGYSTAHGAAYALDPEFRTHDFDAEARRPRHFSHIIQLQSCSMMQDVPICCKWPSTCSAPLQSMLQC